MRSPKAVTALLAGSLAAAAMFGCRGGKSEDPPFHLISDMQWQTHRLPQSQSPHFPSDDPLNPGGDPLFDDDRSNRLPDEHAVARGHRRLGGDPQFLKVQDDWFRGVTSKGEPVKRIPREVTKAMVERGQQRFNIYCAPCHDKSGSGHGLVVQHAEGKLTPPELYVQRLIDAPDGEIFQTITNGKSTMPSYAAQIPEDDRWAIITWVRVLQQSQHASVDDVPSGDRSKIEAAESEAK